MLKRELVFWEDIHRIAGRYILKTAKLKMDLDSWHPTTAVAAVAFEAIVYGAFEKMLPLAIAKASELLKSSDPKDIADKIFESIHEEFIPIAIDGAPVLEDSATAGVAQTMAQITISDAGLISSINSVAREWARDRAAELVGKKWVKGKLVDNPNAEWTITQTVRDQIQTIISDAFNGETPLKDVIDDLQQAGPFSRGRAKMIARTEVSQSASAGNYETWKKIGVAKTKWLLSFDHDEPCVCEDNDGEIVEVGKLFPSGDFFPPAHPNCNCSLVAVFDSPDSESD